MRTMYDNANKATSMKITELIWLDNGIEKIESKHHYLPTDVEEVFTNKPKVKKRHRGHFCGEDVYRAFSVVKL